MPTSNAHLIAPVIEFACMVGRKVGKPISVLDVGPGYGKYGFLLPEYVSVCHIAACEPEPRYCSTRMTRLYDALFMRPIERFDADELRGFDLVLMVDVIEHLDKQDGLDLLDRIPNYVVLSTPTSFFQNPGADEWPTEEHRSLWSLLDFMETPTLFRRIEATETVDIEHGGLVVCLGPR